MAIPSATSHQSFVTRHRPFADVSEGLKVFAVQQGVPIKDALEYASCLLDTCLTQAHLVAGDAGDRDGENRAWATVYLLESVQALLSASIRGMEVK